MADKKETLQTLAAGTVFTVYATAAVATFLKDAEGRNKKHAVRVLGTIKAYADKGAAYRGGGFKVLIGDGAGLVEFKSDQVRVLGYFDGKGRMVLCHSFTKKEDETDRVTLRVALATRDRLREGG